MFSDILNKKLDDLIVTGYTEEQIDFYMYSPMLWWLYLKLENTYLCLTCNSGIITASKAEKIVRNFDIDEDDVFTISSISKNDFGIIIKLIYFMIHIIT